MERNPDSEVLQFANSGAVHMKKYRLVEPMTVNLSKRQLSGAETIAALNRPHFGVKLDGIAVAFKPQNVCLEV